ncbi:DNA-binding transcriptional regulator OxyR [Pasteurellaceae bacterium LIM206]|nr:DNA-binding transcriptional regulator OxyR [Pasteurellaceae bacterium LIM206]
MNIRDLEYLAALAEYKHFRRAADACHVSQPTLSGQIRKLEDELGITLLERTSRKVLFTQSGLILVEQAKKVLREVKLLKEMASNQGKDMTGPLHVGVIPTVGPYLLPYIMPTLKSEFPELELFLYEAQTSQLLDQLESGRLDCAILATVAETQAFIEVPIFNERMLLAVADSHEWAKEKSVRMNILKGHEVLMLDDGHCLRDQALGYCFTAGATENSHFQATSLETLRNMVAANAGLTLMPELAVLNDGNRRGVKYIPCTDPEPLRTIALVYRPGSPLRSRYERVAATIGNVVKPILTEQGK